MIKIKKIHQDAKLPQKMTDGAAGYDLTAVSINNMDRYIQYNTGLCIQVPKGHVGLLFPRSSISNKDLRLCNAVGVLDSDYTGEVSFRFDKTGNDVYKEGDRIGQLVVMAIPNFPVVEVDDLTETSRGPGGFGSTNG